jgi:hypothetical protein
MGYSLKSTSPSGVYKFFKRESVKLFDKYYNKKKKNQAKFIISLREKNNIKEKLIDYIKGKNYRKGISFWFSPSGNKDSYLCRLYIIDNRLNFTINNNPAKLVGNADSILQRAIDYNASKNKSEFEFAIDNLVDIVVQSIERAFNNISYDPVYDITAPQDEVQISQSNKRDSRFADLDWD